MSNVNEDGSPVAEERAEGEVVEETTAAPENGEGEVQQEAPVEEAAAEGQGDAATESVPEGQPETADTGEQKAEGDAPAE